MTNQASGNRVLGFVVTSALTGVLLSGCSVFKAEPANVSASRADAALNAGRAERAIQHAEAAVLADPRSAAYRATLGSAYLDTGRFASAAATFQDAMTLGDESPRTVLSLSLALTGEGRFAEAAALLGEHEHEIAVADLGLAFALAGQPGRGVHLMSNAIRGGENTAKMRQNLAFSYALAGRWREARLMAEQDVPAGQVSDRIEQWAMLAHPQAWRLRVAGLLNVPAGVIDTGQPVQLALANTPSVEELAGVSAEPAELPALAYVEAPAPAIELPPIAAEAAPAFEAPPLLVAAPAQEDSFKAAFAAPATSAAILQDAAHFSPAPAARSARAPATLSTAPGTSRVTAQADGTHLVQLGSFLSEQGARRAWNIYVSRYPELSGHKMVISEAIVDGKHYWRVSAAGFGRSGASAMCGKVKASGEGCFAYADGRPLPGAIDTGTRLARR